MAYDEDLARRVRDLLEADRRVIEKKMFGGIAFLLQGNMAVGVHEDELIVRLPAEETDEALARPGVRIFDLSGGRPMRGWLLVAGSAVTEGDQLASWVDVGTAYAEGLPPK